jgi:hypothetical protein
MTETELRRLAESARWSARIENGASPCRDLLKVAEYLRAAHTFDHEAERMKNAS